jgi:ubiquinone/menaquinone biosynthesis C-methylase UbiE
MADDASTARMARLFDMLADSYDQVGVDFFQPIADGLIAVLPPSPGERWLDLGCGRGAVLLPVARAVAPGGTVHGLDLSPGMVEQCRALVEGLVGASVAVGDASAPEVDGGPFDVVSASLVLFFLPDPLAALRAWLPMLRPGGRVGVSTFGSPDPRWDHVDAVLDPYLPPALLDARTSGEAGPFASDAGVERLLADAGFVDVTTATTTIPVRFADADQWYRFSWSTGQRGMWLSVPEDVRPSVRAAAEERLLAHAAPDGSITFQQQVRYTLGHAPG